MPALDDYPLPWVQVTPGIPYFVCETGAAWMPVGHNDSIFWPSLRGAIRGRDLPAVDRYVRMLAKHKVSVLRLMLEYCQSDSTYFEKPAGRVRPPMIRLWDDLLTLCARHGIRVLLTPVDTFFMWNRWRYHPYNQANGGPCPSVRQMLLCPETRKFIKNRLSFMTERWGHHGVIFGWDLWNEIHPAYAGDDASCFDGFIADLSDHLRSAEQRLHGRSHPQTVSMFAPHMALHPEIPDSIYRHPSLDFATTHLYEEGSIDYPRNTVDAAVAFGRLVRESIDQIPADRPYFDSEHGPIHTFKDHRKTLPADFDNEYFRHMQWAHLASGGAGGGMRWPNRKVHVLTPGMHRAQHGLSEFLPLMDWPRFARRNVTDCLRLSTRAVAGFASADDRQAVVYLLRRDTIRRDGRLNPGAAPIDVEFRLPSLCTGEYVVTAWDTRRGSAMHQERLVHSGGTFRAAVSTDVALAVRPA